MKKKIFRLFIIIILYYISISVYAQYPLNGLYIGPKQNEFICIKDDTLAFRIYNDDAFGTYSLFYGTYYIKGNHLICRDNMVFPFTSVVIQKRQEDTSEFRLQLLYRNGEPMINTNVSLISDLVNINVHSDLNGFVKFSIKDIERMSGTSIMIHIKTLGFETEKNVKLELGYIYLIKSTIPDEIPFFISTENAKLRIESDSQKLLLKYFDYKQKYKLITLENDSCLNYFYR